MFNVAGFGACIVQDSRLLRSMQLITLKPALCPEFAPGSYCMTLAKSVPDRVVTARSPVNLAYARQRDLLFR